MAHRSQYRRRMARIACLVLCAGCLGPQPQDHVYEVTARYLGTGKCTEMGDAAVFAVPYRALVSDDDHPGQQGWSWCDQPDRCDESVDWFDASGDNWIHVSAEVRNGPDNSTYCDLDYDTLVVRDTSAGVHVDLLQRLGDNGDVDSCTMEQARALAASDDCANIDRYDLAR